MRKLLLKFLTVALCLSEFASEGAAQTVRLKDRSDSWSILNESFRAPNVKPQGKEIDARNFNIAGVNLGEPLEKIAQMLGKAVIVQRGDAASGREQLCYVTARDQQPRYLVFEIGEVDFNFYLFRSSPSWKGRQFCARPRRIPNLATASGIRLGMERSQFEQVLGQPDAVVGDTLVYSREVSRKTDPAEFERQRREYPEILTDAQAQAKFGMQSVSLYIQAKFTNSNLTYLAVSKAE
jgi:hypothetical protein